MLEKVNKLLNFILNNKKILFFLSFLVGTFITIFSLIPSYNLDGYCALASGYENRAIIFVNGGRYFTALFYYLIGILGISEDFISVLTIILSNIVLSYGIILIYFRINKLIKLDTLKKIILFFAAYLICYNPFMAETFVFEERFIMTLSFVLSIKAADVMFETKNFIKSFIILFIATNMYQGMICIYLPYYFLLTVIDNSKLKIKDFIKENYKYIFKSCLVYAVSMLSSFLLLKLVLFVFDLNSGKIGKLDLIYNIKYIFKLINTVFIRMFGFIKPVYFYVFNIILILMIIINIFFKKENKSLILYILLTIIIMILIPFIPNIVMNSDGNYTAARMTGSIACIPAFLIIYNLVINRKSTIKNIILLFVSGFIVFIDSYNLLKYSYYGLIRYNNDLERLNEIKEEIENYEKNNVKIEQIVYYRSKNSLYFYPGLGNGYNVRFYSVFWSFSCAISNYIEINNIKEMNNDEFNLNYSNYKFDDEIEYIFDNEIMYIFFM